MPESQQLRDIYHKLAEEQYTMNQWFRVFAGQLERIAVALEKLSSNEGDTVVLDQWKQQQ